MKFKTIQEFNSGHVISHSGFIYKIMKVVESVKYRGRKSKSSGYTVLMNIKTGKIKTATHCHVKCWLEFSLEIKELHICRK